MGIGSHLDSAADYVVRGAALTLWQLLLVLGPALAAAALLHHLSRYVRNRTAGMLGVDAYTYLTAPGVAVHELGHAVFCVAFGHRITGMRLFRPDADGTLGRVEHAYNPRNAYQAAGNFFIGTGPVWLGTALVYVLARCLAGPESAAAAGTAAGDAIPAPGSPADAAAVVQEVAAAAWQLGAALLRPSVVATWRFWLFAYLAFCIGSHITLSRSDLAGASRGFGWLVGLLLAFNLVTLWSAEAGVAEWLGDRLVRWGVVAYAAGAFVVALNLVLAALVFLLSAVGGRSRR